MRFRPVSISKYLACYFSNPFLPLTCKFASHLDANSPSLPLDLSSTPAARPCRPSWVLAPRHTVTEYIPGAERVREPAQLDEAAPE